MTLDCRVSFTGYALGQQLQIESNIAINEILPDLKKKLDLDKLK